MNMKAQVKVEGLTELGLKATYFGLGMLAAKKLRPYAKFFIVGGVAMSAAPAVMTAVQAAKQKKAALENQVEEVKVETVEPCCEEEAAEVICCEEQSEECCCEEQVEECCCEEQVEECCCEEEPAEEICCCEEEKKQQETCCEAPCCDEVKPE